MYTNTNTSGHWYPSNIDIDIRSGIVILRRLGVISPYPPAARTGSLVLLCWDGERKRYLHRNVSKFFVSSLYTARVGHKIVSSSYGQ